MVRHQTDPRCIIPQGITSKIDEQLKISAAVDKAVSKLEDVKTSVTDKVDDLKSKADSA